MCAILRKFTSLHRFIRVVASTNTFSRFFQFFIPSCFLFVCLFFSFVFFFCLSLASLFSLFCVLVCVFLLGDAGSFLFCQAGDYFQFVPWFLQYKNSQESGNRYWKSVCCQLHSVSELGCLRKNYLSLLYLFCFLGIQF